MTRDVVSTLSRTHTSTITRISPSGAGGGIRTPNLLIRRRLKPYFRRFTRFRKLAEQGKYISRVSGNSRFSLRLLSRLLSRSRHGFRCRRVDSVGDGRSSNVTNGSPTAADRTFHLHRSPARDVPPASITRTRSPTSSSACSSEIVRPSSRVMFSHSTTHPGSGVMAGGHGWRPRS